MNNISCTLWPVPPSINNHPTRYVPVTVTKSLVFYQVDHMNSHLIILRPRRSRYSEISLTPKLLNCNQAWLILHLSFCMWWVRTIHSDEWMES